MGARKTIDEKLEAKRVQIASLEARKSKLEGQLASARREKAALESIKGERTYQDTVKRLSAQGFSMDDLAKAVATGDFSKFNKIGSNEVNPHGEE